MTSKASFDMAVEQSMADGLKILARMIATAHRRRVTGGEAISRCQKKAAPRKQNGEAKL